MMLKIEDVLPLSTSQKCHLEVGHHMPFEFQAYEEVLPGPFIWEASARFVVLLFEIERESRAILGTQLVLYNKEVCHDFPTSYRDVPIVVGFPIVNVDDFPKMHPPEVYSEDFDFSLIRSDNRFVVVMDKKIIPQRCFRADRVGFFEGDGRLCGVGFYDIAPSEMDRLMELMRRHGPQFRP